MDGLSRVSEPLPDVSAAERAKDPPWQVRDRSKGASRRRPKKGEREPATASGDSRGSYAEEEGNRPLQTSPGEETPIGQERSDVCYGRDKTVTSIPPKGRLVDIAI